MPARGERREKSREQEEKRRDMRGERKSWGRRCCIPEGEKNMQGGEVHKMRKQRREKER